MELARQHDTTVAKVLHLAITGQARQNSVTVSPRTQIPMAISVPAFEVTGVPSVGVTPVTTIVTNGSKVAAFRIKTGVTRYE
jgi:hypothetical protein